MKIQAQKTPDDMKLLHHLLENDFLIKTPSQDYDDSYCIQYAKKFNAFMVTNDKFRDYIDDLYKSLDKKKKGNIEKSHISKE